MSTSVLAKLDRKKTIVSVLLLVLVAAALLIWGYFYRAQYLLAQERSSLSVTGTVEATTVTASFKVPGKIASLLVSEGTKVELGQEIALLDASDINAKLVQAQGAASAAEGQSREAGSAVPLTKGQVEAAITQARAVVSKAEVGVADAKQKYDRAKALHDAGAASSSQFDEATNNYNASQSDLKAAQGALDQALTARRQVDMAQAKFEAAVGQSSQARGAVQEAQSALDDTHLKAPIAGFITQKYLEQGEMANALTPVYEITDLPHTYVKIYIDEQKIGRVHLGQDAEVTVDAYPNKIFKGKVTLVNDAGEFAVHKALNDQYNHDIRYYEVKVDLPNPDLLLKTGMTARVHILEGAH